MTELPVEHILRAQLPWRADRATECGRPAADVAAWITRDQAIEKIKDQGKQRAAMTTCMTCWETASRHGTWADDPAGVIERHVVGGRWGRRQGEPDLLVAELRAIELLIAAHREEFDATVSSFLGTVSLTDARSSKRAMRRYTR